MYIGRHRFPLDCRMLLFFIFDLICRLELFSQSECDDKKSFPLHHYKFQAKQIIERIRIFYTFFIPFTNNFSNYFKSLTPFVKLAFFVRQNCQDKSSPSLSIDSIAAPKILDCFFFFHFKLQIRGPCLIRFPRRMAKVMN